MSQAWLRNYQLDVGQAVAVTCGSRKANVSSDAAIESIKESRQERLRYMCFGSRLETCLNPMQREHDCGIANEKTSWDHKRANQILFSENDHARTKKALPIPLRTQRSLRYWFRSIGESTDKYSPVCFMPGSSFRGWTVTVCHVLYRVWLICFGVDTIFTRDRNSVSRTGPSTIASHTQAYVNEGAATFM